VPVFAVCSAQYCAQRGAVGTSPRVRQPPDQEEPELSQAVDDPGQAQNAQAAGGSVVVVVVGPTPAPGPFGPPGAHDLRLACT
jgi:hypothetical protein